MAAINKEISKHAGGSALILTVVLTSMLAIVGVMFLMISRIDRMATSGISENKQLDLAVDAVVGKISAQLVWDVPGTPILDSMIFPSGVIFPEGVVVLPNGSKRPEYHDYPGPEDRWLASSEPDNARTWPQISDVTGYMGRRGWTTRNIPIAVIDDDARILTPYPPGGQPADADGDGAADSKWAAVDGITSSRGEPVYAAVRVTDNCGKINANIAYKFDPSVDPCDPNWIDGTSLWQINLMALANRPYAPLTPAGAAADERALLRTRANNGVNLDPCDLAMYDDEVIWEFGELSRPYTPFDISDELELRNRFLLNQSDIDARIERLGWPASFINKWTLDKPIGQGGSGMNEVDWFARANRSLDQAANPADNRYDYRHLATTYSMDRVINPRGDKMVNINTASGSAIKDAIEYALRDTGLAYLSGSAAQLAANIKDFGDYDSVVTAVQDSTGKRYYGYERPCIYISEVAGIYANDGTTDYKSFAVELYKPYSGDDTVNGWRLMIDSNGVTVNINWSGPGQFHVVRFKKTGGPDFASSIDPNVTPQDASTYVSLAGKTIYLQRLASSSYITVDSKAVPSGLASSSGAQSIRRDITLHKCIRRLWESTASTSVTLGKENGYVDTGSPDIVQAHPYLDPNVYSGGFKNVGEIGMVFDANGYNMPDGVTITEAALRLDLRKPLYSRLMNYLTVIDPADHGNPPSETKIKGRININTAPSFVLEQLPWIGTSGPAIAQGVVAYRDGTLKGFRSIGELTMVPEMWYYRDIAPGDQDGFPDLSLLGIGDGAADDIEERDLIFHRVSNLVTVRSDVFTAYILVRIGEAGPQRRVLAILDRSEVKPNDSSTKVKIRALHKVADPW